MRRKTSRRTGQIWANKFACEREFIACGGLANFDIYTARFLQNGGKFEAKSHCSNSTKFSCVDFGDLAKFAIIVRK